MKNTSDKKPGYEQRHWVLFFILFVLVGAMSQGCVPPPPRQAPKPPHPPGGPGAGAIIHGGSGAGTVMSGNHFSNFNI